MTRTPLIPGAVVCRTLASILWAKKEALEQRQAHRPGQPHHPAKTRDRRQDAGELAGRVKRLHALAGRLPRGTALPADLFGLLCASAYGHQDALGDLEDLLEASASPILGKVVDTAAEELDGLAEILLGAWGPAG